MMSHLYFPIVVVIPVGPRCSVSFIEDTINSYAFYSQSMYKIVLADDSHRGTGESIRKSFPEADIVTTPYSMGRLCGIYVNLSLAFKHVLDRYHFDAVLRLDTDALIIGPDPAAQAIKLFHANPAIGMAGQYPNDYSGKPWDISWPSQAIRSYTNSYGFFRKPFAHWILRRRVADAQRNGYRIGESVFGAACFYSEACLRALDKKGWLPDTRLKILHLEEDHLFSILVKAAGFSFGDLSSGKGIVACAWKDLPASPAELQDRNKKIIHSVRKWQDQDETEIRKFFRHQRQESSIAITATLA